MGRERSETITTGSGETTPAKDGGEEAKEQSQKLRAVILVRAEIHSLNGQNMVSGIPMGQTSKVYTIDGDSREELLQKVNKLQDKVDKLCQT